MRRNLKPSRLRPFLMATVILIGSTLLGVPTAKSQTRSPGDIAGTTYACRTETAILDVVAEADDARAFTAILQSSFRNGECAASRAIVPVALARYVGEFVGVTGPGEIWELTSGWFVLLRPLPIMRENRPDSDAPST